MLSFTRSHLVKLQCCVLLDPSLCWLIHVEVLLQRNDKDSLTVCSHTRSLAQLQADPRHTLLHDISMTSAIQSCSFKLWKQKKSPNSVVSRSLTSTLQSDKPVEGDVDLH